MSGKRVLLVDDDAAVRDALGQTLELGGYQAILAGSFIEAIDHIDVSFNGIVISDIRMPGKDGFALLEYSRKQDPDLPVIFLTGEGDVPTAVRGMSVGAYDFLEKPCDPKHLLEVVDKALKTRELVLENRRLKRDLEKAQHEKIAFLGMSEAAGRLREAIRRAGRVNSPVLICGARGTGRGHVARLIEQQRGPGNGLRRIDCVSPMDWTALSEMIGQDAVLLTDVGHLDRGDQSRLAGYLRAHPTQAIFATGDERLEGDMKSGQFDDELFYALGVVRINVPSLSERREDIPVLFEKFLREEIDAGAHVTSAEGRAAAQGLASLDWTGNLIALRNHAKRVAWGLEDTAVDDSLKAQLERVERGIIQSSLRRNNGNATETATALGLPRKTFYDRMARLGLKPEDYR